MYTTTVTQKGQVTIPLPIRKMADIKPRQKVSVSIDEGIVTIKPALDFFSLRGSLKTNKKYNKKKVRASIGKYLAERHNEKNS